MTRTIAIDFESYYDKECSVGVLGPNGYFSHPRFDAYMVSAAWDGESRACHPKEFDWELLRGAEVLSHNASFDQSLYHFGAAQGWWPMVDYEVWHCTADMTAFLGLPRSLKGAANDVLGVDVNKGTRDAMAGKDWSGMTDEFKAEVTQYAADDAILCLRLWEHCKDRWPEQEREISALNRKALRNGVPVDTAALKAGLDTLAHRLFEAEREIPWIETAKILSRTAFNDECRKVGLEPPASLSMQDDTANEWIEKHAATHKWISTVREWRRINALQKKLQAFDMAMMPDGRYYGNILYFGAHTGRFSGGGGNLNLQNLPRDEMFGVHLRKMIRTKPGRVFLVVDLSQIEVRTLCWLAGDTDTLAAIAESPDIYEAFGVRLGLWNTVEGTTLKKKNPELRHKIKGIVLGCGYGCGYDKYSSIAGVTYDEAVESVSLYRSRMGKVVDLWEEYGGALSTCWTKNRTLRIGLPSGRVLNYGQIYALPGQRGREYYAKLQKGKGKVLTKLYGGKLTENASQALARDIFCDALLRIDRAGHQILFHVHDEVIIECDEAEAEDSLRDVVRILTTPPDWIPDIPLGAEGHVMTVYEK